MTKVSDLGHERTRCQFAEGLILRGVLLSWLLLLQFLRDDVECVNQMAQSFSDNQLWGTLTNDAEVFQVRLSPVADLHKSKRSSAWGALGLKGPPNL